MKAEESNSINTWIRKLLMGQASDEEKLRIESWAQEKEENRKMLDQLLNSNDFEQRYSLFEQFDVEKGWMRFQHKYFPASQDTQDHQGHQEPGDSFELPGKTPSKAMVESHPEAFARGSCNRHSYHRRGTLLYTSACRNGHIATTDIRRTACKGNVTEGR